MKLAFVAVTLLFSSPCCWAFFSPSASTRSAVLKGYLDDLSRELYAPDGNPDIENDSREATDLAKDKIDRMGPGDWSSYRDFGDEFDGGDGQMGVAGDGNKVCPDEFVETTASSDYRNRVTDASFVVNSVTL
jgi:hypothetical protein